MIEFKKSLNASQAITVVTARHKAIEEQKKLQEELLAKKAAETEAFQKVESVVFVSPPLEPPKTKIETVNNPIRTLSFKVTATMSKLKELKEFLIEGGYDFE